MRLKAKKLTYNYPGQRTPAIRNIDLLIDSGERLALAGSNGGGKTTLLRLIAGVLTPTDGELVWEGLPRPRRREELLGYVGFLPAEAERYLFAATVWEEVAYGPKNYSLSRAEIEERTAQALITVGLRENYWKRTPHFLSTGEKRRVALAAVLALRPKCLLLDEPLSGVDEDSRFLLLRHLDAWGEEGNMVIMATHRPRDLEGWCRRLLVMNGGQVIFDGDPREWQRQPKLPVFLDEAARLRLAFSRRGLEISPLLEEPVMIATAIREALSQRG